MEREWNIYLCNLAKDALDSQASYESGPVTLPVNFAPSFDSQSWKQKFPCPPYAPVRGQWPLDPVKATYQPHPKDTIEKDNSNLLLATSVAKLATIREKEAVDTKLLQIEARTKHLSQVYFKRYASAGYAIEVVASETVIQHLHRLVNHDKSGTAFLVNKGATGNIIVFRVPLFGGDNMEFTMWFAPIKVS